MSAEPEFDRDHTRTIVEAIADRLPGDWLLIGGGLVALWLDVDRTTEDLDIIGIAGCDDPRLRLLELADDLGLPIETLNSAADFFVRRVPGWDTEIELLHGATKGAMGRVFRPTPTLFLLFKLGRLSDQDLADCQCLLDRVEQDQLPLDRDRVRAALKKLPPTEDTDLTDRRAQLLQRLN